VSDHRGRTIYPGRGALGAGGKVQLLLHIAIERTRGAGNAIDLMGYLIERWPGRILAFNDSKGFKNCTHLLFPFK
jgi:hypothetical protein